MRPSATDCASVRLRDHDRLDDGQQVAAAMDELVQEQALAEFVSLAVADVVEAVDGPDELSAEVQQGADVHDNGHPRSIGPFDVHLFAFCSGQFPGNDQSHGRGCVRHDGAVTAEQPVRPIEALLGVALRGRAPPQHCGAVVELLNASRRIAGIDGRRPQLEQGAIALLARPQRLVFALGEGGPAVAARLRGCARPRARSGGPGALTRRLGPCCARLGRRGLRPLRGLAAPGLVFRR